MEAATEQRRNGAGATDRRPTEPSDYAALNAVFGAILGAVVIASRQRAAQREPLTTRDLLTSGAASFTLAKVIARERIGTWVREPFVEEDDGGRPRGHGLRHAVGELITCTRCVGAWSALGLVGLRLTSPATGRVVNDVLAVSALNDWLQASFKLLCAETDRVASDG